MTRTEIEETVRQILVEELEIEPEKIVTNARMKEDVGIDSLDFVDIVVLVDKKFGVRLLPNDIKKIVTIGDFYSYIEQKMN
ncbi:MAG: acyl carrier protein [Bacteroidales bacterium]|nr:acyl carrier protein [Bacteroidales bacterium]